MFVVRRLLNSYGRLPLPPYSLPRSSIPWCPTTTSFSTTTPSSPSSITHSYTTSAHTTTQQSSPSSLLRRVLFNVPGSERKKLEKATTLNIDSVVLDLEDGVATNMKQTARDNIVWALDQLKFGRSEILIRINSVHTQLFNDDMKMIELIFSNPKNNFHGIVVPKVDSPKDVEKVRQILHSSGRKFRVLAAVESAKSVVNLKEICSVLEPKSDALIFASEDYCADTGMTRTPEALEMLYARSAVVNHAVAFDLQAIDMVCVNYKDSQILMKEAREGCEMGFHGKQAIHPNQIPVIYNAWKPTESVVDFARRVLEGNEKQQALGKGAFEVDGKMIDMPVVKWAQNIINRATIM